MRLRHGAILSVPCWMLSMDTQPGTSIKELSLVPCWTSWRIEQVLCVFWLHWHSFTQPIPFGFKSVWPSILFAIGFTCTRTYSITSEMLTSKLFVNNISTGVIYLRFYWNVIFYFPLAPFYKAKQVISSSICLKTQSWVCITPTVQSYSVCVLATKPFMQLCTFCTLPKDLCVSFKFRIHYNDFFMILMQITCENFFFNLSIIIRLRKYIFVFTTIY